MDDDYRRLADRIADDIATGRLRPGERLPPQRAFARRRGIAGSTAGRVYGELVRQALRPAPATGTAEARTVVAGLLATPGWRPDPDGVLFTGNARQAIAAALASLVRPGGRVGVEALTYPLVKEIAARLGCALVPLAMDQEGLRPDALAAAHRSAPLSALYVQPTLHNPTSVTTSEPRKHELARVVRELALPVVEDRIWSFLADSGRNGSGEPLAAHVPELAHVVDGLSKRVAPGLTVGFLVVPPDRAQAVAAAVRSGGWSVGRFALEAGTRWVQDGTVARLVAAKRVDAARRQRLLARELASAGGTVRSDPYACYAWWELPASWRADTFTAAAAAHGIAVTPGNAFAVGPQRAPDAVRLGLASAPEPELVRALRTLAAVARRGRTGP
ncbi:MAG: PLP-dependent aminotransferase family protein [Streptomyces turgidiscabies]|nr:PLP-dependent aminotransferase family protein [Streptomyces turgidiscabies]